LMLNTFQESERTVAVANQISIDFFHWQTRKSVSGGGAPLSLLGPHFLVGCHKLTTKVVGVKTPLRIPH
jgi:hypothetical protein